MVTWIRAPRFPYENIESFFFPRSFRKFTLYSIIIRSPRLTWKLKTGTPWKKRCLLAGGVHHFPVSQGFFPDSKSIQSEQFVRFIRRVRQRNLRLEPPNPSYGFRLAPCHSQKGHESYCSLGARQGQLQGHLLGRKMELRQWCLLCK